MVATNLTLTNQASNIVDFTDDQVALISRTIAVGCTSDEMKLFLYQCRRTNLDPFSRQIYAIKRGGKMTIQTSIDGYRLIAERSGKYEGQTIVQWCGDDGIWTEVWLKKEPPSAAKVGVYREKFRDAVYGVAKWSEYAQNSPLWQKMGALMLSKCSESLALRKAFPQELSGIYTAEEMQQADQTTVEVISQEHELIEPYREPEIPDEVKKGWRDLRAKLNKSLMQAKTYPEIISKQNAFSEMCKQGEKIWSQKTHHNEDETFGFLLAQHSERTKKADELASPIGIDRWIDLVKKSDEKEMVRRIDERDSQPRLQIQECEEALHDRACQLGFTSYSDLHGVEA